MGSALSALSHTAGNIVHLQAERSKSEISRFEEPLQDYTRMMAAIQQAMAKRDEVMASYHAACSKADTVQATVTKLQASASSSSTNAKQLRSASDESVRAVMEKEAAKARLDRKYSVYTE